MQQTKDSKEKDGKVRVFALAKELNLETKVLLEFCKELGYAGIKNQLNALEPDQVDALKDRAKKGPKAAAPPTARPVVPPAPPKLDAKLPTLGKPKVLPPAAPRPAAAVPPAPAAAPAAPPVAPKPVEPAPAPKPAAEAPPAPKAVEPKPVTPTVVPAPVVEAPAVVAPVPEPTPAPVPAAEAPVVVAEKPAAVAPAPAVEPTPAEPVVPSSPPPASVLPPTVTAAPARLPTLGATRPMNLNPQRPANLNTPRPAAPSAPPRPAAPVAPPAGSAAGGPPRPAAPSAPAHQPPRPAAGPSAAGAPPRPGMAPPNVGPPRPLGPGGPLSPRPPMGGPGRPPIPGGGAQRAGGLPPRSGPVGPARPAGGPAGFGGPRSPAPPPGKGQIKLTAEQITRLRQLEQSRGNKRIGLDEVQRQVGISDRPLDPTAAPGPSRPGDRVPGQGRPMGPAAAGKDDDDDKKGGPKKPGEVAGRGARQISRQSKGGGRSGGATDKGAIIIGAGGRVDIIERSYGSRAKIHRGKRHQHKQTTVITGKVEIAQPITVRTLSEAIGMKVGELILKIKHVTTALYTINSPVEFEVAELVASDKGIELVEKKTETAEDTLLQEVEARTKAREEHLVLRPPIVTIMGHVDHGKTSLLDKIRQEYGLHSDVVSTEAGGITQVLRAWRVEKDGNPITFLDTPGHEAFTKMRARGANVTDIAVIVVSAVDGVMPQTQEAVAHAKAAEVDIIVAVNKCDLPGAQPDKVKGRLYEMELVPEDMGGDVPVIFTSAVTGQGIGDLLDNIALRAEFAELKADPDQPATGTCLEAYRSADEGVMATLLIANGTLNRGDVLLCGSTFGRVRAMYDDLGRPIDEAGPSTPVRVTGLDAVPDADDPFYVVGDISTAREIAEKRASRRVEQERFKFAAPKSVDALREAHTKAKITELKIILKAEARGSVEAIKKELEKLVHDEVRTRVLHAGVGAITESDVSLALTSPDDTLIVGFNVTTDDAAMRLAEQRGVKVREYDIIYKLTDDIKAALEGRLKPVEEVVHLGRAVVRQTFKVGKVGTIAGCYVTSGTIERNARVRVIREGTVIYPPADKVVGLDSLKRFKDDAKEVREGFECGMKIAGFDDVKVGDVLEAFKIEVKQRTL